MSFHEIISINSFNKYFLSTYYSLGAPPGAGSTAVNKADGLPSWSSHSRWGWGVREQTVTCVTRAAGKEKAKVSGWGVPRGWAEKGVFLRTQSGETFQVRSCLTEATGSKPWPPMCEGHLRMRNPDQQLPKNSLSIYVSLPLLSSKEGEQCSWKRVGQGKGKWQAPKSDRQGNGTGWSVS